MMKITICSWFQRIAIASILFIAVFNVHAKTASEIYEQAAKSTVVVSNIDETGTTQSFGSGVFLPDGSVVTNCHVIKNARQIKVRNVNIEHTATLRYSDWDRDICSLNVENVGAQAIKIGNTKNLKVGAKVYAIGAPKGLELSLSDGIVSSLREVEGGHYIQTTAAISPGSSGGGLFDENGELVGLTTFYFTEGQNLNFAVPIEWVKELAKRSTKESSSSQTELQWLNKSIELISSKNWPILLEHCQEWTNAKPSSSFAWFCMGAAYYAINQPSKAIEAHQHSLRINPKEGHVWHAMGLAYYAVNQPSKAIESYQNSLHINSKDAGTWESLGQAFFDVGQPVKAIDAYQQSLNINPKNTKAWNKLGKVYVVIDQPTKAIEAYQHALSIDPEFADAWFNLGIVYFNADQTAKAIEAYQYALSINPEDESAWQHMCQAYVKAGQATKAIEATKQVLRINPKNSKWWFILGAFYSNEGQRDKVQEVYKQLKPLDPELAERLLTVR